jgi:hypothetical protein
MAFDSKQETGAISNRGTVTTVEEDTKENVVFSKSLLSDKAILAHMDNGSVVIVPFIRANLSTSSYDVTLGKFFYRESPPEAGYLELVNLTKFE